MKIRLGASALFILLSACGGGGGGTVSGPSSGGSAGSGGSSGAATIFQVSGTGPLVTLLYFDSNANRVMDDGWAYSDGNGAVGRTVVGLATGTATPPSTANVGLLASGVDATTGFFVSGLSAPQGATVVSPVTTIIDLTGDAALVRRGFGLASGSGAIRDATDLLHFASGQNLGSADSAVAQDAARITAVNFRIIALMRLLTRYQGDAVDSGSGVSPDGGQYIAKTLKDTGSADFTSADFVQATLQQSNDQYFLNRKPEQLQVAAELFAKFMRIVPTSLSSQRDLNAYHLAFRFFVLARIKNIFQSWPVNDEVAPARALTEADLRAVVARFADAPAPAVGARAYALPDYVELRGKTTLAPELLLRNDATGFPYGVGSANKTITAVRLDARFAGMVAVRLNDSGIVLEPTAGYAGDVYFDYTAQSGGVETSSRVYVRIRL